MGDKTRPEGYIPVLLLLCYSAQTFGWRQDLRGNVAVETRGFWESAAFSGQGDSDVSLFLAPEFNLESDDGHEQWVASPFVRVDSSDRERSHFDLRELSWSKAWDEWEVRLGVQRVFWGVAESNHVVDILNQTDLVENPDGEDKLGQPMATLVMVRPWGTVDFIVMPGFRERTFPGRTGRLRTPEPVEVDAARYDSSEKSRHVDFAIRYESNWRGLDLGIHQFMGTSREPVLVPTGVSGGKQRLTPFYAQIDQTGIDLAYTVGGWLFKFEGIFRAGQGPGFGTLVGGFEYTYSNVAGTAADIGLLLELDYDTRGRVATTPFNRDVFFGVRLGLNDSHGSQVLAGALVDVIDDEGLLKIEAQRRLGEQWRLSAELRAFHSHAHRRALEWIEADDYLSLELSRYF